MAIQTSLFFLNNRTYSLGTIVFDLILSESHNFNNAITVYNIEDGSSISDHIQNELINGQFSGLITNFSIYEEGILSNKAQDAFDSLNDLWKKKQLVTLSLIHAVYENVAINSISINRDGSTGESLVANISFQQLNIVKLQEVELLSVLKIKDTLNSQNKQSSKKLDIGKNTFGYGKVVTSFHTR